MLLRRSFWSLVVFETAVGLVTLVGLDPLLLLLLNQIVALGGDPFVGNTALIGFALSPPGFIALAVAAMGATFVAVATFGGGSLIVWGTRTGPPPRQSAVWGKLLARTPVLLALSLWMIVAALLLTLPGLGVALAARRWLLSGGDIYYYLATRPPEFIWAVAAVTLVTAITALGGLSLLLRTGLAVPICLTRPLGAYRSLRLAVAATHGRQRALLLRLLAVTAALALLWSVAAATMSLGLAWLIARPMSEPAQLRVGALLAVGAAIGFAILAAISRGAVLLVLLRDSAAAALPASAAPSPPAARRRWVGVATMLAVCATIPLATVLQITASGAAAPHAIGVTAHRAGSTRAPENTLAALHNAIADGADVVEIDAQETADGEVVLLHDTDLRRVAGVARSVWEMRSDELQRLDVGSWFAPGFAGERIPTLRAFAAAARGRVRLNVELKDNGHGADLAARVVAVLRETGVAAEPSADAPNPGSNPDEE